jgi:para-aminobenzoate synthetase component 1
MLSKQTIDLLKSKAASWVARYETGIVLDSNYSNQALDLGKYELIVAAGAKASFSSGTDTFSHLQSFIDAHSHEWIMGYLTYDLKNQVEELYSAHPDRIGFPVACFFVPAHLLVIDKDGNCIAGSGYVEQILETEADASSAYSPVVLTQRVSEEEYIADVEAIRQHIIAGDVYELNYCVEFYAEHISLDPVNIYNRLRNRSAVPFGCFLKHEDRYLAGASPERFLAKRGKQIISQPIKGTARRGKDQAEDDMQRKALLESEKERAENLMIVDLVRNDLARSAVTGSVKVDELFGIYTFPQVHQMISTVSATQRDDSHIVDVIRNAFPMGSMTGAPKIMAMKLIEQYERTKRGLYSGAIGYFSPGGDIDFNVVIRSIQYNHAEQYVNFEVGGAITYDSVPEREYEECLLKAKAMIGVLEQR